MNENRRTFLKSAGRTALGFGCGLPLLSAGCGVAHGEETDQWAMVVDVEKFQDVDLRNECVRACRQAHSVPTIPELKDGDEIHVDAKIHEEKTHPHEVKWIWTETYEHAFPEQVHARSSQKDDPVLVLCNHCAHPPCVKVCPTQATWKREQDGIVTMDMHRCIGCRYCIAACPYGSRSFNWLDPEPFIPDEYKHDTYPTRSKGVVEKCNFCVEILRAGKDEDGNDPQPACVKAVKDLATTKPDVEGALIFGKLDDPPVRDALKDNRTITRRPGLGTDPNVFYIV